MAIENFKDALVLANVIKVFRCACRLARTETTIEKKHIETSPVKNLMRTIKAYKPNRMSYGDKSKIARCKRFGHNLKHFTDGKFLNDNDVVRRANFGFN